MRNIFIGLLLISPSILFAAGDIETAPMGTRDAKASPYTFNGSVVVDSNLTAKSMDVEGNAVLTNAAGWSQYPATQDINIGAHGLSNIRRISNQAITNNYAFSFDWQGDVGDYSIGGPWQCTATGTRSIALGMRAQATNTDSFVWNGSGGAYWGSSGAGTFTLYGNGLFLFGGGLIMDANHITNASYIYASNGVFMSTLILRGNPVLTNVVYGVSDTTAYRGDCGASVSGQVAILNTNTFPLQSGIAVSNIAADALPKSATNALAVTELQITGLSGNGLCPIGTIVQYAASNAPTGWLLCDGSAVSTNIYSNLFAVIGTQYGGATTNMNLPDLRGRVALGMGEGAGLTLRNLANTGGVETVTLTVDEIPAHHHYAGGLGVSAPNYAAEVAYASDNDQHTMTSSDTGGGLAHQNMPPYITLNFIIKY